MPEPRDVSHQDSGDDATIGFDADGRVLSVSGPAARALGYARPDELEGADLALLVGEETAFELIDRMRAVEEAEALQREGIDPALQEQQSGTVSFMRQDGSRVSLNATVTPETSGGWITLAGSARSGNARSGKLRGPVAPSDIAGTLRWLAQRTGPGDSEADICALFARELRAATGTDTVAVARSTGIAGMYETLARDTEFGDSAPTGGIDLPPALVPQRGAAPVAVESLEALALFEPVVVADEEVAGAFIAARAELADSVHMLLLATAPAGYQWPDATALLYETGALTLAGTVRATELGQKLAFHSRARETVRQIGALASQDLDGGFLEAARKVIARRLPVSAISIHAADPVTSRCYIAASSADENSSLAPGFEWQLDGSLEQRVLKSGRPVFVSAASPDRVSVPPATIAHWRSSGLQAVAALPLREGGEVIAVLLAGFTSEVRDKAEVARLLESITPAVYLGVGLSGGRPGAAPEPDETAVDPGFVSPKVLLALTRAAAESPDTATLFASVTEWLLEIIPSARVSWGTVDSPLRTYNCLYSYSAGSDTASGIDVVRLDGEELAVLGRPGLKLPEPGGDATHVESMRAAVTSNQDILAVVTAWPRQDEPFTTSDLARLERVCEFVTGPLGRILETEASREAQRKRDMVIQIGAQAVQFHEPDQALRSVRPLIGKLLPHDRAMFLEFDRLSSIAITRFDSAASPNDPSGTVMPLASLPAQEIIESTTPVTASLGQPGHETVFGGFSTLVGIPVQAMDGPDYALLLLSEKPVVVTGDQLALAQALSSQFTGAAAGWHAYRATRDSTRDLREVRKQFNLLLDSAPIALISTDASGVCTRLEGHGLDTLGIEREEMLGKSVFELTGKLPQLEDAIRQALRGVPATAVTSLGMHSAEVWAQPVTEIDGTVKGVNLVGFDVSERIRSKRAVAENRALQKALKDRSRIVSTVSHELRNPLTSIIAYTDILAATGNGKFTPEQANALSVIQRSASHLNAMVRDLLGLDSGNYELEMTPVRVGEMMREIIDAQIPTFHDAGQTLNLSLPEVECIVQADQVRLTQVVTNLLSNASKYSPANATVCVEVTIWEQQLQISVIDDGPGIPADQIDRVWDPGIRIPNSITRTVPGSGLGLSIARKIVELHGGSATIKSTVGLGTTVTVTLPGATVDIESTGSEKSARPKTARTAAGRQVERRRRSGTG